MENHNRVYHRKETSEYIPPMARNCSKPSVPCIVTGEYVESNSEKLRKERTLVRCKECDWEMAEARFDKHYNEYHRENDHCPICDTSVPRGELDNHRKKFHERSSPSTLPRFNTLRQPRTSTQTRPQRVQGTPAGMEEEDNIRLYELGLPDTCEYGQSAPKRENDNELDDE